MANMPYWHRQVELPPTAGRPSVTPLRPGDVVYVGPRASVQFSAESAITIRVIHVNERPTYHGWCWLDGYQLDANGDAVERREIFVQTAGLARVGPSLRRIPRNVWPSAAQTGAANLERPPQKKHPASGNHERPRRLGR